MGYPFHWNLYKTFIRLFIRSITGEENIPKDRPFIAVANHTSYFDDVFLPYTIITTTKKPFCIFVNSRYYKSALLSSLINLFYHIPVDVGKDVKDGKKRRVTNALAMKRAAAWLRKGNPFLIFPEGGRSADGKLKKGRTGAAKLALLTRVPVLPVGIIGSHELLPKGAIIPRFRRADIIIGKPLSFRRYYCRHNDRKTLERLTNLIMENIANLTGQRYNT